MVQSEENGNNGKKIEVSLSKEQLSRLEDYAERKETSVNSVVRDSVDSHLDWCDTKNIISEACESGDLRENSKVCRHLEKQARQN
jgi:hypothetical protein